MSLLHLGPKGGGRTFCGLATDTVAFWSTIDHLAGRRDFLPGHARCRSCLRAQPEGERVCACGCFEPVVSRAANARYATPACRTRDWKLRKGYTDQRAARVSRNASRGRRATPLPRLPYLRVRDALVNEFRDLGETMPLTRARMVLRELLTQAQRDAVKERGL